ncbi:restriction endonuclease PLD domain-containing protein [Pedobacter agri]|uniref:restriction endonuclease PLD domain-containing protein n=1 Tax=Pedobacter agri TaxID=454586 RepID=UPI002931AF19|nr:restriction endonuclease PLD domain-containing protein [Pedobacter agri]
MLYNQDLEELIFHRHQIHNSDELIVLSGYLGPSPVARLEQLPFNTTVIYGMYGSEGIMPTLHNSLISIQNKVDNVNIFYSQLPVHSKCYAWRKSGEIIHALIGSANFSTNGLTTPFREVLAETTFDTFRPLNAYIQKVLNNSVSCLEVGSDRVVEKTINLEYCNMTLLGKDNEVQNAAGLNWGQNPSNHTTLNDAYIPIRTNHIKDYPHLFPPKQINPQSVDSRGRLQRHNDAIEIIWDDGITMEGLLEGSQPIDGVIYPKQISSFPIKSQLGEYVRMRIGVPLGQPVRRHHLERYGRTDVTVSLLGEGVYKFNFSV